MEKYTPTYGLEYYQEFSQEQINLCLLFSIGKKDWLLTDFLLNSPDLPFRADIHSLSNSAFLFALSSRDDEIIKYLIFNLNLEKTEEIEKIISKVDDHRSKFANSLFEFRELNGELLSINQNDKIFKL